MNIKHKERLSIKHIYGEMEAMKHQIEHIYHTVIQNYLQPTPLQKSEWLSKLAEGEIYLKLECDNPNGSFKVRGALNALSNLYKQHQINNPGQIMKVAAASAGNHAQGVAFAAKQLGCEAHIFLPKHASKVKRIATEKLGANVYLTGASIEDAFECAKEFCERENAYFIHPYNDENIIFGQATCALEAHRQLNAEPDYFVCSIGGGGLAAGACYYFKEQLNAKTHVVGVEQEVYNSAFVSLQQHQLSPMSTPQSVPTIADGVAIKKIGELTFQHMSNSIEHIVTVSEQEIYDAIAKIYTHENIVVEGAGAMPVAALLKNIDQYKNTTTILCLSGRNIDLDLFQKVLECSKEKS